MAKVRAVQGFTDKKEGVFRSVGDTFSCDKNRVKELIELDLVKEVEADAPAEEKPKKKTAKAKK